MENDPDDGLPDRLNLVYLYAMLQGVATLFPWSALISGQNFYTHKLGSLPQAHDFLIHFTIIFMTIKSFCLIAAACSIRVLRPERLITVSMAGNFIVFVCFTLLPLIPSLSLTAFYIATLVCAVISAIFSSEGEAGLFTLLGSFPPKYIQGYILGMGLAGIIAILINIIALGATGSVTTRVFSSAYFGTASAILLFDVAVIFLVRSNHTYRHYADLGNEHLQKPYEDVHNAKESSYWSIFKKLHDLALSEFLTSAIRTLVFPTFVLYTVSTDLGTLEETAFTRDYFIPVAILVYYIGGFAGKSLPLIPVLALKKAPFLFLAMLRIVFFPLILFGNIRIGDYTLPFKPWYQNDYAFMTIVLLQGLTGGYLSTLCLVWGPSRVKLELRHRAARIMTVFLAMGLVTGAYAALGVKKLIIHYST